MEEKILSVKMKLDDCISQLSEVSWMFSKQPGIYFTRDRKLPFPKVISALLSMEGGSLTSEMLKYFAVLQILLPLRPLFSNGANSPRILFLCYLLYSPRKPIR